MLDMTLPFLVPLDEAIQMVIAFEYAAPLDTVSKEVEKSDCQSVWQKEIFFVNDSLGIKFFQANERDSKVQELGIQKVCSIDLT